MTDLQRIMLQRIEMTKRINAFGEIRSDEPVKLADRQKLITDLDALDDRYKLAIADDGAPGTPEAQEWADLNDRFDLGELFGNVIEHRASSGVIAEIQAERGLGGNDIPVEMLMEHRAVTPAPGDVGQNQNAIEGFVFPQSAAAFLGIPSPIVAAGDQTFPILTSDPAPGTPAENSAQAETTGAFSADVLSPSRIQASFFWSREDQARMAGKGDALREALQGGLGDALDKQILAGTNGLLTGTNLPNNNVSAITAFADYVSNLGTGRVDGRYAGDLGQIRVLMGSGTFAHAGSVYRATESDRTALDRLVAITAGVRVSAHVPAVSNSNKQNALIRLGMRQDMIAPIWGNLSLIPDEITKAASGQIVLTAGLLHAVKVLRSGGFHKQQTQHA